MLFEPYQSWLDCITNIRRRLPACDRVIADYRVGNRLLQRLADIGEPYGAVRRRQRLGGMLSYFVQAYRRSHASEHASGTQYVKKVAIPPNGSAEPEQTSGIQGNEITLSPAQWPARIIVAKHTVAA